VSRGFGRLQRAVLKILEENRHFDTFEITAIAYAVEPGENGVCVVTDAQYASVRPALAALARQGMAMRTFRGSRRSNGSVPDAVEPTRMTRLYGPAVRCKRFSSICRPWSCINVSGLTLERYCSGPSWISARASSLADRPRPRAIRVTSVRMRREDRSSISSHPLADLGVGKGYMINSSLSWAVPLFAPGSRSFVL